ncbi:MAG: hypothetical protein R6W70_09155, partial [bacterium]
MKTIFNMKIFYVSFLFTVIIACGDSVSEDKYSSDFRCGNGVLDPGAHRVAAPCSKHRHPAP